MPVNYNNVNVVFEMPRNGYAFVILVYLHSKIYTSRTTEIACTDWQHSQ